jgi:glycerol-3-phosphate acyltransferase PlsY
VFASFKGGKGIATALGMLLVVSTIDILIAVGIFVLVVSFTRFVSLGSIIAAVSVPITLFVRENIFQAHIEGYNTLLPFIIGLSSLVIFTHRKNIVRLISGNENKLSFKKKKSI